MTSERKHLHSHNYELRSNNENFLRQQFAAVDINNPLTYKTGNRTTIGNCAFVALHSEHDEFRNMALVMLENYKKYANGSI